MRQNFVMPSSGALELPVVDKTIQTEDLGQGLMLNSLRSASLLREIAGDLSLQ